jgi:hypothetical protein
MATSFSLLTEELGQVRPAGSEWDPLPGPDRELNDFTTSVFRAKSWNFTTFQFRSSITISPSPILWRSLVGSRAYDSVALWYSYVVRAVNY